MEPITAEDVKWSIETALKAASLNAIYSTAFSNLEGAAEVDFRRGGGNQRHHD